MFFEQRKEIFNRHRFHLVTPKRLDFATKFGLAQTTSEPRTSAMRYGGREWLRRSSIPGAGPLAPLLLDRLMGGLSVDTLSQ
jgi:hypothetical protein